MGVAFPWEAADVIERETMERLLFQRCNRRCCVWCTFFSRLKITEISLFVLWKKKEICVWRVTAVIRKIKKKQLK